MLVQIRSDQSFKELSEDEEMEQWEWARKSQEVQETKVLQKEFIETVKLSKHLILKKKENLKKKHLEKTHKILVTCRQYGGPLTISTIQNVQKLNEKQLLAEIGYLRHTTYPNIRQQQQVRDASGKVKLKKLDSAELKMKCRKQHRRGVKNEYVRPRDCEVSLYCQ